MHQPKPEKETYQDLSLDMKLPYMYVNFMVWSVLLYGSETWTLKKDDIKRLESCEMWIWRRMEKISWREHVRNEEVLRRVGEERSLRNTIWKRKARWIGHVMRQKEGMLRTVIKNEAFNRKRWRTTVLEGPAIGQTT